MTTDRLIEIKVVPGSLPSYREKVAYLRGLSPVSAEDLQQQEADAHLLWVRGDRDLAGQCSLWWDKTPALPGHRVGAIGHYAATDAAAGEQILDRACEELAENGATIAIGPMDGNTWRRYLSIVDRGSEPLFFLEPDSPDSLPQHFLARNFKEIARYSSAVNPDLTQVSDRLERVGDRLEKLGVKIRSLEIDRFETELHKIYRVITIGFRNNFLYSPLSESEFVQQYLKLRPYIRPEFVLLAERDRETVGFLFAVPDWLQAERDAAINTIIIKTTAILPQRLYAGLGHLLIAKCQETAKEMGYTRAIHALMQEGSYFYNISRHYAKTIRRYALFGKELTPR